MRKTKLTRKKCESEYIHQLSGHGCFNQKSSRHFCGNCNDEMQIILSEAKEAMKDQELKFEFNYKGFDFVVNCDILPERIDFK